MAIQERITRVRITASLGGFREWLATAAVLDTPAGGSVVVTITMTTSGTPPAAAGTLTLRFHDDAGTQIASVTLLPNATSQTHTFHFTDTGAAGGAARAGTVEMILRAQNASATPYDVESDGSPNSPGTGQTSQLDRGWIRGTTTATSILSNIALGGGKTSPAAYDESLFVRTTLGAALYVSRALTVAISNTTPALSAATNSATSGNFDVTFSGVVDNRFPAANTTVNTSLTVPNSTLTGQPATLLTTTNDSMAVDPRLTATHHFQVDDNVFGASKNVASKQMLSTQSGFLAVRLTNARGEGKNGLTVVQTLTPVSPGTTVGPTSSTTANRDGQDGWSTMIDWTASKPGGAWNKTTSVSTTDITGASYLVDSTDTYTMLAPDPNIIGWPYLSVPNAAEADHAHAGDTLCATLIVTNQATGRRVLTATDVRCALVRFTASRYEFLAADDATWVEWTADNVLVSRAMTETTPGSGLWRYELAATGGWGATDILGIRCSWKVGGTPYQTSLPREMVGAANGHAGYALDPIGLALAGVLSTR